MKHRDSTNGRTWPINTDGHAIGIDLGATAVRAAILALSMTGGGPAVTVHGLGSVPLPPGAVINGAVNEQAAVTQALKELWAINGFSCSKVILGVANPQVVVRPLQIPNLNAQQRAKALPFQAREIIALPLDEVVLDYAQVGPPNPETGMLNGLLIATPRRPVLAAVEAVERAGLKVARVDLSSFGALRSIGDQRFKVQAVIDLGAQLTSIVIHHHGVPQLVRTLARGGQELTDLLVENLNLSPEEAERAKRETGLTGQPDNVSTVVETAIRPLLAEIRSSINYFRAGSDGAALEGISLTGGAAALPGLAAVLSTQNGVPVTVIDPMQHIGNRRPFGEPGTAESEMHSSAVAFGLAIGAAA
ncbi:type IV pilus assembly protein PilM [Nakamurella sp. PAMC28650]|uniref:type IV pilus assembly protein PilM n=1 Tax=Nakamurella sp. PAMC28650 TaxID=2762325 RepID=UPI00164E4FC5|nr:type IV pilus assembly protein PilM [Nakamurella sp. PAMC28650]QNK80365.1 type IV pilus assembly protein PilM [Nakamurella sp. PAMC28650]